MTEEVQLDELRELFVANVSHELRTPISLLQGYSEAIVDGVAETKEDQQELAQVILDEACLLYTSPSPRDRQKSRMPSSA